MTAILEVVIGTSLGLGLLLVISPWTWPQRPPAERTTQKAQNRIERQLRQAGLEQLKPAGLILSAAVIGLLAGAICLLLAPILGLAVVVAVAAASVPFLLLGWRAKARQKANRQSWPDVVDQLVSAVRSGLSLPDSICALESSGPAFSRAAFAQFRADYESSGNFERCLNLLKQRLSDPIADRILETLRMARQVGGNELPSILRTLSLHLRQEIAIRGEVEARQSWILNAARLASVAPWVILALLSTRPEAAAAYNSASGLTVILLGLVATAIAYRAMIALARLPEQQRIFE
ncbi:MAG: type II secretion system F family protein [Cryobacterium sp.]|nr:type II secretion system F family protein [Cryobacterium sp.]MBX3116988.1 type II secretion system F family protein [Cryobacterium sp.]